MEKDNNLPVGWKRMRLEDLCLAKEGLRRGPFGSAIKKEFFVPEGYKVYEQANAIHDDAYRGRYFIGDDKFNELINFSVRPGDLIVSCSGTLGRIAEIPNNAVPGVINQALLRIRLKKDMIATKYFLYNFRSAHFQKKIFDQSQGTAMSNLVGIKDFKLIELKVPPISTQLAIISKIEELFSELDKGIENLHLAKQQLKAYRQAVLKWAFEGRLTNKPIDGNELPEEWQLVEIKSIGMLNPKIPDKDSIDLELEIQFLPMKLVEEIVNRFQLSETRKFGDVQKGSYTPFIDGDIIFAKVTPCMENGKIAIVGKLMNGIGFGSSEFHVIRCTEKLLNKFLFYFIVQDKFRNRAAKAMTGAVGLRRVPKQFIENYIIPLPTIEEQYVIVQEIESRLSICDKINEAITYNLKQIEVLKQSILRDAFEGKLV